MTRDDVTRVLVIDDDAAVLRQVRCALPAADYLVATATGGTAGLERLRREACDVALVDLTLPGLDGLAVLRRLQDEGVDVEVVALASREHGVLDGVAALRAGAAEVLLKPLDGPGVVLAAVRQAAARRRLWRAAQAALVGPGGDFHGLVGQGRRMRDLFTLIAAVAPSRSNVLLQGETGTGKELVARAIHQRSGRRRGGFVAVSCSALSPALLEAELFGHTRGAFTGAGRERQGLFATARGGTLFLDDVSEIPRDVQVKLLRALQHGEIRPLGQARPVHVDVRIIAASQVDLKEAAEQGRFREDLYYRLAVIPVRVPALREHPEDVPLLCQHFLRRFARGVRADAARGLDGEALRLLCGYSFPGNVRELENLLERAAVLGAGPLITAADLPRAVLEEQRARARAAAVPPLRFQEARQLAILHFERGYLRDLLRRTGGNLSEAARLAGLDRTNLRRALRHCGVDPAEFRQGGGGAESEVAGMPAL